jgi:hypothetical protein
MKIILFLCLFTAACAPAAPPVFAPVAVDMPVPTPCNAPPVAPPPDVMAGLKREATLTDFTKACAQQVLLDRAVIAQFMAVQQACTAPINNAPQLLPFKPKEP